MGRATEEYFVEGENQQGESLADEFGPSGVGGEMVVVSEGEVNLVSDDFVEDNEFPQWDQNQDKPDKKFVVALIKKSARKTFKRIARERNGIVGVEKAADRKVVSALDKKKDNLDLLQSVLPDDEVKDLDSKVPEVVSPIPQPPLEDLKVDSVDHQQLEHQRKPEAAVAAVDFDEDPDDSDFDDSLVKDSDFPPIEPELNPSETKTKKTGRPAGAKNKKSDSTDNESKELATLASGGLDVKRTFENAIKLLGDQSLTTRNPDDVKLSEIQLTNAKVDSFMDSLHNIPVLKHSLEIISGTERQFKRNDELDVLVPLLENCKDAALICNKTMELIKRRVEDAEASGKDVSVEELILIQNANTNNIEAVQKVISSTSRLIQLERISGGRPWQNKRGANPAIGFVQGLDKAAEAERERRKAAPGGDGKGGPRVMSAAEMSQVEKGDGDEFYGED